MKKLMMAAVALLAFFSEAVASQSIEGQMLCTVTSNQVISVEVGRSKILNGHQGKFEKDDQLIFSYGIYLPGHLSFSFWDVLRDSFVGSRVVNPSGTVASSKTVFWNSTNWESAYVTSKIIHYRFGSGSARLERYGMRNWEGIVHIPALGKLSVQVFTLDCQHISDKIEEVLEMLSKS